MPFAEEEGMSVGDIMSIFEEAIQNKYDYITSFYCCSLIIIRSVERNFELMLRATTFEKVTIVQLLL